MNRLYKIVGPDGPMDSSYSSLGDAKKQAKFIIKRENRDNRKKTIEVIKQTLLLMIKIARSVFYYHIPIMLQIYRGMIVFLK